MINDNWTHDHDRKIYRKSGTRGTIAVKAEDDHWVICMRGKDNFLEKFPTAEAAMQEVDMIIAACYDGIRRQTAAKFNGGDSERLMRRIACPESSLPETQ